MTDEFDLKPINGLVDMDSMVSPVILAGILGCNVSLLYQEMQVNRLPNPIKDHTYRECIQTYLEHFKKNADLKIVRAKQEYDLKVEKLEQDRLFKEKKLATARPPARVSQYSEEGGEAMPPLMIAKFKQDIRVNIARETQLWIKASIERGEYISLPVLVELAEPFIMSIRQNLLTIALESEDAQRQVDLAMENLHTLGSKLLEGAMYDSHGFIEAILAKEVIPEEIEIDNEPPRLL